MKFIEPGTEIKEQGEFGTKIVIFHGPWHEICPDNVPRIHFVRGYSRDCLSSTSSYAYKVDEHDETMSGTRIIQSPTPSFRDRCFAQGWLFEKGGLGHWTMQIESEFELLEEAKKGNLSLSVFCEYCPHSAIYQLKHKLLTHEPTVRMLKAASHIETAGLYLGVVVKDPNEYPDIESIYVGDTCLTYTSKNWTIQRVFDLVEKVKNFDLKSVNLNHTNRINLMLDD